MGILTSVFAVIDSLTTKGSENLESEEEEANFLTHSSVSEHNPEKMTMALLTSEEVTALLADIGSATGTFVEATTDAKPDVALTLITSFLRAQGVPAAHMGLAIKGMLSTFIQQSASQKTVFKNALEVYPEGGAAFTVNLQPFISDQNCRKYHNVFYTLKQVLAPFKSQMTDIAKLQGIPAGEIAYELLDSSRLSVEERVAAATVTRRDRLVEAIQDNAEPLTFSSAAGASPHRRSGAF